MNKYHLKEICHYSRRGLSATLTLALLSISLPSLAQVNNPINPGEFENNAERDAVFGGGNDSDFNLFNLMRNAQIGTLRNSNEVIDEQRQDLQKGADDFRRQQLERLGNTNAPASNVAPSPGN